MSTTSPRHSENVTNLGVVISKVTNFGSSYQPSNAALKLENLQKIKINAEAAIYSVTQAEVTNKKTIAERATLFETFDPFITRVSNTFQICGASSQIIEQGLTIIRQLRGKRASNVMTDAEHTAAKEKGNDITQVTIHNSTYDTKVENFGKLITFLSNVPEYKPNEQDLVIENLWKIYTQLKTKNEAIIKSETTLENARTNRNHILYDDNTGVVSVGLMVKQYVKAAYGAGSDQYNQISGILFATKV